MRVIDVGLREGHEYRVRDTWLTVPNLITLARFALVPVFVWLTVDGRHLDAFVILAVLSGTDWVDGYVARRFDMISTVGRWLDPVADRLSLLVVAVTFVATGIAPLWLALAIAIPDVVLAAVCLWLFGGSPDLPVTVLGKVRTALLLVGTPLLLLARVSGVDGGPWSGVALALVGAGCLLHILAAGDYLVRAVGKACGRTVRTRVRTRPAGADPLAHPRAGADGCYRGTRAVPAADPHGTGRAPSCHRHHREGPPCPTVPGSPPTAP